MEVRFFEVGLYLFILLFIGVYEWLMPGLTRRDILFGVTVAPNARVTAAGRRIIGRYRIGVLLLTLILGAATLALLLLSDVWFYTGWSVVGVVALACLSSIPYLLAHHASRSVAAAPGGPAQPGASPVDQPSTAELRPRRYNDYVPLHWELLPLAIIAATVAYLAPQYAAAPALLPQHYDLQGHVVRYAAKTIASFFLLVWLQLFMEGLLLIIALLTVRAKAVPGAADQHFRRVWLRALFGIRTLVILMFGALAVWITANIRSATVSPAAIWWVTGPFLVIVLGGTLTLSLRTGQGGARLGAPSETATDRTSDRYWKLGVFYVNPDDPSILVERRFGVGWTVNLGNPRAIWLFAGIIVVPFVVAAVIGFMTAH